MSLRPPPSSDHLPTTTTFLKSHFELLQHKCNSEQQPPVNNGHYFWGTKRGRCTQVLYLTTVMFQTENSNLLVVGKYMLAYVISSLRVCIPCYRHWSTSNTGKCNNWRLTVFCSDSILGNAARWCQRCRRLLQDLLLTSIYHLGLLPNQYKIW